MPIAIFKQVVDVWLAECGKKAISASGNRVVQATTLSSFFLLLTRFLNSLINIRKTNNTMLN